MKWIFHVSDGGGLSFKPAWLQGRHRGRDPDKHSSLPSIVTYNTHSTAHFHCQLPDSVMMILDKNKSGPCCKLIWKDLLEKINGLDIFTYFCALGKNDLRANKCIHELLCGSVLKHEVLWWLSVGFESVIFAGGETEQKVHFYGHYYTKVFCNTCGPPNNFNTTLHLKNGTDWLPVNPKMTVRTSE